MSNLTPGPEMDREVWEAIGADTGIDLAGIWDTNSEYPEFSTRLVLLGTLIQALGKRGAEVRLAWDTFGCYAYLHWRNKRLIHGGPSTIPPALCLAILSARDAGRLAPSRKEEEK